MSLNSMNWPRLLPRLLWRRQCPLCTSVDFQEAELEPMDTVLRLFLLTPVRCSNCWRRYYWFATKPK
jgi:hypothetical protein